MKMKRVAWVVGILLISQAAYAQGGGEGMWEDYGPLAPVHIAASIVYGVLGLGFAILGYKVFELVLPFDVNKELSEDDNPAVGVVMAAVVLGVSVIMAAAIHG